MGWTPQRQRKHPMYEVWITNGNGTACFIVGGLTRPEALVIKDNIEYGIVDVDAWIKPEKDASKC